MKPTPPAGTMNAVGTNTNDIEKEPPKKRQRKRVITKVHVPKLMTGLVAKNQDQASYQLSDRYKNS